MTLFEAGITNFTIKELVHPYPLEKYGQSKCLQFLDLRIVKAWQWIRSQRGKPIYINVYDRYPNDDYPTFVDRGLRWAGISETGQQTSQHFFGRALDGDEIGTPAHELYEWVLKEETQKELLKIGVTTIEDVKKTPGWIHLDCRNWGYKHKNLIIVE